MSAEHVRPCTDDCDHGENPHLSQGYYCPNCGRQCNTLATGHTGSDFGTWKCESNPELVKKLNQLNER